MSETVNLALPYIAAAQAQKHVTHNEALRMLDALVMLAVRDRDLSAPPGSPAEGDRYLVNPTGAGAFAGKDGQIAQYRDGAWAFHAPLAGWLCYVEDEDALLLFDGSDWGSPLGPNPVLQNLALLGVGTVADATNPFAAKLNNALWTARAVGEGGDGDLRYKLNKEAAGNTLSMLFQTGYSGRAEIGLTGDDDLHLKVSDDGVTWRDAVVVAAADGRVSFPFGIAGARERLAAPRTYYVRTDGSDANDGLTNNAGGAFATLQKAADVVFGTLDLGGHNVTVQLADGTYGAGVVVSSPQVGAGTVTIQGNASTPGNVIVATTGVYAIHALNGTALALKDFEVQCASGGGGIRASTGAFISYANLRFGACAQHQVRADDLGRVTCTGNYTIAGNGQAHWSAVAGGVIRCQSKTVTLSGTPAFSSGFSDNLICGMCVVNGNTFSGSATGPRYSSIVNSVIYALGGATYLPGDASGTANSGGQYV